MGNFLMSHSLWVERVAGRSSFMVTASLSREAVLTLHFTQEISTATGGLIMDESCGMGLPER